MKLSTSLALVVVLLVACGCSVVQQRTQTRASKVSQLFEPNEDIPCPPEELAGVIDDLIGQGQQQLFIRLVRSTEGGPHDCAWLISNENRPIVVITERPTPPKTQDATGFSVRALKRARSFIAEDLEFSGRGTEFHLELAKLGEVNRGGPRRIVTQEEIDQLVEKHRRRDGDKWFMKDEYLTWTHQARVYGLQIVGMRLIDVKTESWEITAKPIGHVDGGEIWMRFSKDHGVSAEYGR